MSGRALQRTGFLVSIAFLSATPPARTQPTAESQPARLRVLLPASNAQLMIDDKQTRQTGTDRLFVSPPLEPGKSYSYTIKMILQPNNYTTITRVRQVAVRPGQEVQADLRAADDKQPDRIVIRYVPTPQEVVDAMLRLADVGKNDVVYDLGCGDGRIVVTAVEKFGARHGVGVDLDPQRIRESQANARAHHVEDKVEFRQGDILDIKDLSSASVVAIYLGEELNLRLRPLLQKTLKPGARIVSHRFTMGDWKPLKSITVTDREGERYHLHLWKIGEEPPPK